MQSFTSPFAYFLALFWPNLLTAIFVYLFIYSISAWKHFCKHM